MISLIVCLVFILVVLALFTKGDVLAQFKCLGFGFNLVVKEKKSDRSSRTELKAIQKRS